jgi:hypothetical protein
MCLQKIPSPISKFYPLPRPPDKPDAGDIVETSAWVYWDGPLPYPDCRDKGEGLS